MRKALLFAVLVLAAAGIGVSAGHGYNNSAPTFECITCHVGDMAPDMVRIEGIPKAYAPGRVYQLTVVVAGGQQSLGEVAGGFAVVASAGELIVRDERNTQISEAIVTHTQQGSRLRKWAFAWKAPAQKTTAAISVMAMAANGDFSPAGDQVGSTVYTIKPAQ